MTLSLPQSPPVPLADTLSVVDEVLGAIDLRIPAHVSRDELRERRQARADRSTPALRRVHRAGSARIATFAFPAAVFDELRRLDRSRAHSARRSRSCVAPPLRSNASSARAARNEIAAVTGFTPDAVAQLERLADRRAALSADEANADGELLHALIDPDATCPARSAESVDAHASVRAALDASRRITRACCVRYYLEDATLDDIAVELGRLEERIRQIREAAEKKLREDFVVLALCAIGPEPPLNHSFTRPSSLIVFDVSDPFNNRNRPNHTLMTPSRQIACSLSSEPSRFHQNPPGFPKAVPSSPAPWQEIPARPALPRHSQRAKKIPPA